MQGPTENHMSDVGSLYIIIIIIIIIIIASECAKRKRWIVEDAVWAIEGILA